MLIRIAEPVFLGPGLGCGCEPPGSGSVFADVELICVLGVAVSTSVFGVTGLELAGPPVLELAGPPVKSDWGPAPAVPVPGVLESEPVCALAGKASIPTRKATITGLSKRLGEAGRHMFLTLVTQRPTLPAKI